MVEGAPGARADDGPNLKVWERELAPGRPLNSSNFRALWEEETASADNSKVWERELSFPGERLLGF